MASGSATRYNGSLRYKRLCYHGHMASYKVTQDVEADDIIAL